MDIRNNKTLIVSIFIFAIMLINVYALITSKDRILDITFTFLATIFLLIFTLKKKGKRLLFNIFLAAIAFSSIVYKMNFPGIRISPSETVIIIIFFVLIMFRWRRNSFISLSKDEKIILIFAFLYVLGGLITLLFVRMRINKWINSCLIPALILYISFSLIYSLKQIDKSMIAVNLSIAGFLIITLAAFYTGYAKQMEFHMLRGQFTTEFKIGKIEYQGWATWFGAISAMFFPLFFISSLTIKNLIHRLFNITGTVLCLYFCYRTATRGGVLSIIIGAVLIIGLSFYKLKLPYKILKRMFIIFIIITVIISFLRIEISTIVEQKFFDLFENRLQSGGVLYRANLIYDAYFSLLRNPFGIGFDKLWDEYEIDEANFFSWSANGVGLLGVIGFWGLSITLIISFFKGLINKNVNGRLYSIIGICTLISTFIAATSSDQILHQPQTVLPFWLIIGATIKAVQLTSIPKIDYH